MSANATLNVLHLQIIEARHLKAADVNGYSDPYIKIKYQGLKKKTKVVDKSLNPKWNEDFLYHVSDLKKTINLTIWDKDSVGADDFLGQLNIDVTELVANEKLDKWFPVEKGAGEVHLGLTLCPPVTPRSASELGLKRNGKKWILSCDGGGIRGLITATFLKLFEKKIGTPVSDLFDMFVGTSTGGLISLGLAVCKLSAAEVADLYNYERSNRIMNKSAHDNAVGLLQAHPKYSGRGKKEVLSEVMGTKKLKDAGDKYIILTSYEVERKKIRVFSNHNDPEVLAVEVGDATSAAPGYFPAVQIGEDWFLDGGVVCNNPTILAYAEAKRIWGEKDLGVISLGTGSLHRHVNGKDASKFGLIQWITNGLIDILMDQTTAEYQAALLFGDHYYRINTSLTEASDEMDDCTHKNLDRLEALGEQWFNVHGQKVIQMMFT